jgi:hypothetical protein
MKAKIEIKNGYWTYNEVAVKNCSFPIQTLVASFIKAQIFNTETETIKMSRSTELVLDKKIFGMPNFVRV